MENTGTNHDTKASRGPLEGATIFGNEAEFHATIEALDKARGADNASLSALFDAWRALEIVKRETAHLHNDLFDECCADQGRIEEEVAALPVATVEDLWKLIAMLIDPESEISVLGEALARRARAELGLKV